MRKALTVVAALAMALTLVAVPAGADETDRRGSSDEAPSVYDIARDASKGRFIVDRNGGDFDILVLALKLTGLDKAVDDPSGDFTVFAPTDDTFQATFGGRGELRTVFNVLRAVDYDIDTLRTVLLYHVTTLNTDAEKGLSFAEVAAALEAGGGTVEVPMLAGGSTIVSSDLTIDGANSDPSPIVATDIGLGVASNGVIHVIGESVLLP